MKNINRTYPVFEIDYIGKHEDGTKYSDTIRIRAINAKEAKRIAKQITGAHIKDMTVSCKYGYLFKAAND